MVEAVKRKRGRPRKHPIVIKAESAVKRGRGRPRKDATVAVKKVEPVKAVEPAKIIVKKSADSLKPECFELSVKDAIKALSVASEKAYTGPEKELLANFAACLKKQVWFKYVEHAEPAKFAKVKKKK